MVEQVIGVFQHETAIAILTAVLVLITAVYAYLTFSISSSNKRMAEEIAKQTEAMLRPVISFRIEVRAGSIFCLVLENTGKSTAESVNLKLDRDFFRFGERNEDSNLKNFNAFRQIVDSMASGERIKFDLAQGWEIDKEHEGVNLTPSTFQIEVEYLFGSKRYQETQKIDLRPYMSSLAVKEPLEHLEQISASLKKIAK
ncbi:MAG: hypothetical protein AAFN43_09495 [Pseudomonadota bacterium]